MTIPPEYIGHSDFLERGIIQEFYPLTDKKKVDQWIEEDILPYKDDYRVHIVRATKKTINIIQDACIRKRIRFKNHTSNDRLSKEEEEEFFQVPLNQHIVIAVKGFWRRADLIPNSWKLRIGATHELYTNIIDNNVQIQGLPGRMSGYWRGIIEGGHRTGPYRTSIKAIKEYEDVYNDPFGINSYQTSGFKKTNGKISSTSTMLNPKNILNLEPIDIPEVKDEPVNPSLYRIYDNEDILMDVCKILGYSYTEAKEGKGKQKGFKITSLNTTSDVASLADAIKKVPTAYGTNNGIKTWRTYYPCYVDTQDNTTLRFVVIIRPKEGDELERQERALQECDSKYVSLTLV
jgi:hypothetical protein